MRLKRRISTLRTLADASARTRDLGGTASTSQFADGLCQALA